MKRLILCLSCIMFTVYSKAQTTSGNTFLKKGLGKEMSIKLILDSITYDQCILKYVKEATPGYDAYDIFKLDNPDVNISSSVVDTINLTLDARPEVENANDTFFLNIAVKTTADYTMEFSGIETFELSQPIYLADEFTGTTTDLRQTNRYVVSVDKTNALTEGRKRLMIVFPKNAPTGIADIAEKNSEKIILYPTTTEGAVNIASSSFVNGAVSVAVFDATGRQVISNNNMAWDNNHISLDLSAYKQGMYFITLISANQTKPVVLRCIKQ